jgi:Fur family ferric uptake transcriptional regulator
MNRQSLVNEFAEFLRERGLRMTGERRHILEHIFGAHTHFEAEDLHTRLRSAGHRIARATVYRTLALLVEANIIRQVVAPPDSISAHYELVHGLSHQHEHLQCLDCGETIEVSDTHVIEEGLRQVAAGMGFEMTDYTVRLVGRCEELRRTGTCSRSGLTRERES